MNTFLSNFYRKTSLVRWCHVVQILHNIAILFPDKIWVSPVIFSIHVHISNKFAIFNTLMRYYLLLFRYTEKNNARYMYHFSYFCKEFYFNVILLIYDLHFLFFDLFAFKSLYNTYFKLQDTRYDFTIFCYLLLSNAAMNTLHSSRMLIFFYRFWNVFM